MIHSLESSLCPSYKQVDAFGPDDLYEDEEVTYVTLDLGSIEPTLIPSSSTYRLIGLDTPTPFLQLSGTIFKGRHEMLLGTELIFTDGKGPNDTHKKAITHVANTEQRICFNEVRLQPKGIPEEPRHGQGKGKSKAVEEFASDFELEAASQMVDRVTGKIAPRARASRAKSAKQAKGQQAKAKIRKTREGDIGAPLDGRGSDAGDNICS